MPTGQACVQHGDPSPSPPLPHSSCEAAPRSDHLLRPDLSLCPGHSPHPTRPSRPTAGSRPREPTGAPQPATPQPLARRWGAASDPRRPWRDARGGTLSPHHLLLWEEAPVPVPPARPQAPAPLGHRVPLILGGKRWAGGSADTPRPASVPGARGSAGKSPLGSDRRPGPSSRGHRRPGLAPGPGSESGEGARAAAASASQRPGAGAGCTPLPPSTAVRPEIATPGAVLTAVGDEQAGQDDERPES